MSDNIGPKILKLSANIVNKSITVGEFPCLWKEAKVKPLFKSGAKDEINNYRPISVLPTFSKLIEKWVDSQFFKYLDNFNLLNKSQSGFRPKHSTESALILMIDSWLKTINEGEIVGCVLIDFRKAFDLVDHKILLNILLGSVLFIQQNSACFYKQLSFSSCTSYVSRSSGFNLRSVIISIFYKWLTFSTQIIHCWFIRR